MELKGSKDEMMQDETRCRIKLKFDLFNISIISPNQQMGHFLSNPTSSQIFFLRKTIYDFRKDFNNVSKCAQICQYTKIYQRSRNIPVYALNIQFSAIQQQQ